MKLLNIIDHYSSDLQNKNMSLDKQTLYNFYKIPYLWT